MNKYDEMELNEVLDEYCNQNGLRFEGTTGVRNFEKICGVLGYSKGNFLGNGVEIYNFLADNPGAIECLLNWIGDASVTEWRENLIDELEPEENEAD